MSYNNGNGYNYNNGGYAPAAQPQAPAPQYGAPQGGYSQPAQQTGYPQQAPQNAYPQQSGYRQQAPQNQAPNNAYGQQQNAGYQQQGSGTGSVSYSQYSIFIPEKAMALEDTALVVCLNSIKKELNLYIEKLMSRENKPLVKFSFDLTMGDTDCARLFGKDAVTTNHKIRVEALMAGYQATNFLDHIPQCTKSIILTLGNMKLGQFKSRDGSTSMKVDAFVIGMFVDHASTKYKNSDIKAANLPESKPYHVNVRKPKANGGASAQAPYQQQGAPYGATPQSGYSQQAPAQNPGYPPQGQPAQYGAPQQGSGYGYGYAAQNPNAAPPMPGATQHGGNGEELAF